jgi:alanine-synthesizing transaminase
MLPDLFAGGMSFVAEMRARVRSNISLALEQLARNQRFRAQAPDGGYYLFPEVFGWSDEEALVLHLLNHGVLVHPGYFYGYERGTHLMISCLTEPARFAEGINRIVIAIDAA